MSYPCLCFIHPTLLSYVSKKADWLNLRVKASETKGSLRGHKVWSIIHFHQAMAIKDSGGIFHGYFPNTKSGKSKMLSFLFHVYKNPSGVTGRVTWLMQPLVLYCKPWNIRGYKILPSFYFELFAGGIFFGFLTHGKGLVEGDKSVEGWICSFLVNCETRENFSHAKMSCFTVFTLLGGRPSMVKYLKSTHGSVL